MGYLATFLPKEDRHGAVLLYVMMLALCFNGYDAGIMTVILADPQFTEYYSITPNRQGLVSIIPWASTAVAQLFLGGILAAKLGRLWSLRISITVMIIGVVVQIVPNTYGVLILGRLITGLGFGCNYIATNLYVAEVAPRTLRGSFVGTVSQFGYQLGTLIAFWAGYGMSYHTSPYNIAWRISNFIQIPIGLLFIVVSFFYPESPRYLLEKHGEDPERVLKTLAKIRSGHIHEERIRVEFEEMVASHEYRKRYEPGFAGLFKSAAMRKRLCYGFYAAALQQVGGIAAVTMYAALIYESLGWDQGRQALIINGVRACLELVIVLVNTFTVDRYGRKTLLIAGFSIQSLALLILASLTTSFPNNDNTPAAVVEVVMLFVMGLTYCWSNGPIAPTIATEIFPQHVREKAFGISMLGQSIFLIAITQPWPTFNDAVGPLSYWLLLGLNAAALVSVIVILPETKGVSLERMDAIFGQIDAVEGAHQEGEKEGIEYKLQEVSPSRRGSGKEEATQVEMVAKQV